ncbi:unnamed protein product [Mytilus coruscus]|uniref:Uncharacterized protein n=1 Tax=Mytilus coruscus TaxID=42192 RepID=A0A6J8D3J2_MYTCO|nr:unnamed protein product [Mytilus coruscus]
MSSDKILLGPNYLFVCFLLLDCVFPVTSNRTNNSTLYLNEHHLNSISEKKQGGNETENLKLSFVSQDNSTVYHIHKQDKSKYKNNSRDIKETQGSFQNSVNNSITFVKDDEEKKSNLQDNLSDRTTNTMYVIELTSVDDSKLQSNQITKEPALKDSVNTNEVNNTENFQFNISDSHSKDKHTTISESKHKDSLEITTMIPRHKILKHLSLVPIEDEPFGGVLWKNNSKYLMSVCVPIGVGIAGAACIIGMAYAARRCYKNERKIQEIRAALQQQISANRSDETVLLDSSDDET